MAKITGFFCGRSLQKERVYLLWHETYLSPEYTRTLLSCQGTQLQKDLKKDEADIISKQKQLKKAKQDYTSLQKQLKTQLKGLQVSGCAPGIALEKIARVGVCVFQNPYPISDQNS